MAPPQSSAPCRGFAISQLPHGSRPGLFSSALTSLPSQRDSGASFLQASFSGELFGLVIIPSGPASSRTIRLMRTACSRQVDLRPGNGAELQTSPVVPSHRPASTRPTASLTQTRPASTDTRIPDAEAFGLARGVLWCRAFLTLDFTPQPAR